MKKYHRLSKTTKWQQGPQLQIESQWQDLKRITDFLLPIVGFVFIATVYASVYAILHIDEWVPNTFNNLTYYLFLLQILIITLLPLLAASLIIRFIFKQAENVVSRVYLPPMNEKLAPHLRRRLLGVPPLPPPINNVLRYPFIVIKEPTLDETHWGRWFGGPAVLVVEHGCALFLEDHNQASRIVGPGIDFLKENERIKEVVDLKPQTTTGHIMPWTKDGIQIKMTIKVVCQINFESDNLGDSIEFKSLFNPSAIKSVVERMSIKLISGRMQEQSWLEDAWEIITGSVSAFVAGHSLDEWYPALRTGKTSKLDSPEINLTENIKRVFSHQLAENTLQEIRLRLSKNGIKILDIQIIDVDVPRTVRDLRSKYWEIMKDKKAAQSNSRAEANRIRSYSEAYVESTRATFETIISKLASVDPDDLTELLVLSTSGLLDQGEEDPMIRPWIANETFIVLEKIRKMLSERF
jgi:hypothetical protein